jgi:hypothetical protein
MMNDHHNLSNLSNGTKLFESANKPKREDGLYENAKTNEMSNE